MTILLLDSIFSKIGDETKTITEQDWLNLNSFWNIVEFVENVKNPKTSALTRIQMEQKETIVLIFSQTISLLHFIFVYQVLIHAPKPPYSKINVGYRDLFSRAM